jgi:NAD(P)-dependent dehydrogenase (short-subunit alcohol dehydrogenase family)
MLEGAARDAGPSTLAITCDVTDEKSCRSAIDEAAAGLGGIDALVYAPGIGPLARLAETDAPTWRRVFETNVTGAALVTSAAIEALTASAGTAAYLSSVSASLTPPWPGLGAYAVIGAYVVSKAALDKLVEAWRVERPDVGFTRLVVGDCGGGEGESITGFADAWDVELATELGTEWFTKGYITGTLIAIDDLVDAVDGVLRGGPSLAMPTVMVTPRRDPAAPS